MALAARNYVESHIAPAIGIASLRGWLHGSWGLLFSHPDDFASYGFEADRWLVHVQEAFTGTAVRPIALASCHQDTPQTWIADVGGSALAIRAADAQRVLAGLKHSERTLFRAIVSATSRFVMIVDESLHLRRTFAYSPGDRLPSPIELATMAARLRSVCLENRSAVVQCVSSESVLRVGSSRIGAIRPTLRPT